MTDHYRIVARDKDGKELGMMYPTSIETERMFNEGFLACPNAILTIERLPPEEVEPRKIFVNYWAGGVLGIYDSRNAADENARGDRSACIQFIEAKITENMIDMFLEKLDSINWPMTKDATTATIRVALAAALGIEE